MPRVISALESNRSYQLQLLDARREPSPTILAGGASAQGAGWVRIEEGELMPVDATTKPPYRVPLLSELPPPSRDAPTVISTFSGCGGSCLGFRMAGFRTLAAVEFVPAARDTYAANFPGVPVVSTDIRQLMADELLAIAGARPREVDVLEGSPPCASFSTAGRREKGWGKAKAYSDTVQRSDDLFFEFARLLDGLQPRAFVAENVSGLTRGKAKGYFIEILAALKRCGYRVVARMLNAQWLGVPQSRARVIFVGVREDLGVAPRHPEPLPYRYSVRDAIPSVDGGAPPEAMLEGHAIGREWDKLAPGQQSERYFSLVRPAPGEPSPTVTALGGLPGVAGVTHPHERRKFTIPELRRICGFPDDFHLTGTYAQQWERLGRAVPPVMMSHVARAVRAMLEEAKR